MSFSNQTNHDGSTNGIPTSNFGRDNLSTSSVNTTCTHGSPTSIFGRHNLSTSSVNTTCTPGVSHSSVPFSSSQEATNLNQEQPNVIKSEKENFGALKGDGRINITISPAGILGIEGRENRTSPASLSLLPSLLAQSQAQLQKQRGQTRLHPNTRPISSRNEVDQVFGILPLELEGLPKLNILMQVIGSRGDIQPFLALALVLAKHPYNHRVRLATHLCFESFIVGVAKENGLDNVGISRGSIEFYPLAGDPAVLMSFMVRNPGLIPSMDALSGGEIRERRKGVWEILISTWESCYQTYYPGHKPFVADVLIANPPGFGHIHCAEKLGIPLHIMFTMPWTPTHAFPHPLANLPKDLKSKLKGGIDEATVNYLTYPLLDILTWQGIGDLVNRFRMDILRLDSWNNIYAPTLLSRFAETGLVKHMYCWSPELIPKPDDWGLDDSITIPGFWFLNLTSSYTPPTALSEFMSVRSDKPLLYIGFGSIVAPNPEQLTATVLEAISLAGVRALVSKGWGTILPPDNFYSDDIFFLDNVPHDYLFPRVALAVHHGGAGTTAAAIKAGIPNIIIPFFGDQLFWGEMVERKGAGCVCHSSSLTSEKLKDLILRGLSEEVRTCSRHLGSIVNNENGTEVAAQLFIQGISTKIKTCEVESKLPPNAQPEHPGIAAFTVQIPISGGMVTTYKNIKEIHISARTAVVLDCAGLIDIANDKQVKLTRRIEYGSHIRQLTETDPVTGGASALLGTLVGIGMAGGVDFDRQKLFGDGQPKELDARTGPSENTPKAKKGWDLDTFNDMMNARKPLSNIIEAGIRSPIDLSLSVSRGFHNLPSLFKDDTVRPLPTVHSDITGMKSGITVASKQLATGLYDGISGLVTQPIKGTKEGGVGGFFKGVGKGIGGVVVKPAAGVWGVGGYFGTGVIKQIGKLAGHNAWEKQVRALRRAEGKEAEQNIQSYETEGILNAWKEMFGDTSTIDRKGKGKAVIRMPSGGNGEQLKETMRQKLEAIGPRWQEFRRSQPNSPAERRISPGGRGSPVKSPGVLYPPGQELGYITASPTSPNSSNSPQRASPYQQDVTYDENAALEQAIKESLQQPTLRAVNEIHTSMGEHRNDHSHGNSPPQPATLQASPQTQQQQMFSNNTIYEDDELYAPADGFRSYQPSVPSPAHSAFAPPPLFHRSSSSLTSSSDVKSTIPDLELPSYERLTPTFSPASPPTVDAKIAAGAFALPSPQIPIPPVSPPAVQFQSTAIPDQLFPSGTTDGGWTPTGSTANSVSGQQFTPTASTVDLTEMHPQHVDYDEENDMELKWALEQSLREHNQSQQSPILWNMSSIPAQTQPQYHAGNTNNTNLYEYGYNFNLPRDQPPPRPPRPDIYLQGEPVSHFSSPALGPPPRPLRPGGLYDAGLSSSSSTNVASSSSGLGAPHYYDQRSRSTGDLSAYAGAQQHTHNIDEDNDEELLAAIAASKETARAEEERKRQDDEAELIDYMKRVGLIRGEPER